MAGKVYRHGMTQGRRDFVLLACLYGMIAFMLLAADLAVQNYVLRGHQCLEGKSNDGTTQQGYSSQGNAAATKGR
jgi:hypothetical protein